jgi:hypothetical protein
MTKPTDSGEHAAVAEWGNRVAGRCPACNGSTLFVAVGGHVTCSLVDCPDPTLVADFLDGIDRPDMHVVEFTRDGWHLEHTMRCRLDGMAGCLIHRALTRLDERPVTKIGRFDVDMVSGVLHYREASA